MSNATLILGMSGTGKSTSIRNLNPAETFIINVLAKPLPFKGARGKYKAIKSWDDADGNYLATDDYTRILRCIDMVNKSRPEIKIICLDDMQYLMANEYMKRATENGFAKFTEMAQHIWMVINALTSTRDDLYSFVMSHSELDVNGRYKAKTIGKMLDEKITLEGMFTTIFHSLVVNGEFKFLTQNDGYHVAKSPLGMFEDSLIDNDLSEIIKIMQQYNEGE